MADKLQPYLDYKDSGIEWLGEIPFHWDCIKLKYVADLEGDKIEPGSAYKYVGMENIESWSGKYIQKEDVKPEGLSTSFAGSDVLFGKLRPYLAKSWLADFSGICSSEFLVLRSKKVSPKFLNYYSLTEEFITQVDSSTYGSKMPRASWDFISLMGVPVPVDRDSEKIANFLDYETAKIDTLIEKQEQLIKLLKEKRQAVISHAVTKGLNPNAPMRDSGVEWLGKVPEHWEVSPLKYVCKLIDGDRSSKYPNEGDLVDEGIPFVSSKNIVDFKFTKKNLNYITQEKYDALGRGKLAGGDLVITVRGTIGHVGIFDPEVIGCNTGFINAQMMIMRPKVGLTDYLQCISESSSWVGQLDVAAYGSTVRQLSNEILGNMFIAIPPADEIPDFIETLRKKNNRFEELISIAEAGICLMQERRTALISAAVTGKIDVRNWQTPTS